MNPHKVLGIPIDATSAEVLNAYRRKRSEHHPDRGGDAVKFHEIELAFTQLSRTKIPCPLCFGKGSYIVRDGIFARTVQCPKCWKT